MFKDKFITNLMGMATWYGLFSMAFDTISGKFVGPLVVIGVATLIAWKRN